VFFSQNKRFLAYICDMENKSISVYLAENDARKPIEAGTLVGFAAIISAYKLLVPPPAVFSLISDKFIKNNYSSKPWQVFSLLYKLKADNLYQHLVFALKYEGINLLAFKKLFEQLAESEILALLAIQPKGQYSRRIWFLYEWLMQKKLAIADLQTGNAVLLVDTNLQYALSDGKTSARHRIKNNLAGQLGFCPMIRRTAKIEMSIAAHFDQQISDYFWQQPYRLMQRAVTFLALKNSRASFEIETENPTFERAMRWAQTLAQSANTIFDESELLRLQKIVLQGSKTMLGYRQQSGFIGEYDRQSNMPIVEHISARHEDLPNLMQAWFEAKNMLQNTDFHPILAAAQMAFGFVFIHPFADGNGRLHRYILEHILAVKRFVPQDIIFPIASAIAQKIADYQRVLQNYSHGILPFIDWQIDQKKIIINNQTADYYSYFDATQATEFLFDCLEKSISNIKHEIHYLQKYDALKTALSDKIMLDEQEFDLLVKFLEQNDGKLSKRAQTKEFSRFSAADISEIEQIYTVYFRNN
jgi:Fic family protein